MMAGVREKAASWLDAMSPRARRAVSLMLVAIVVIAATSVYYLRPWMDARPAVAPSFVVTSAEQTSHIYNYDFKSAALGWAVEVESKQGIGSNAGRYWVFRTVDGGRHWQQQLRGQSQMIWLTLTTLQFFGLRTGFVVAGDPMSLFRTTDGGEHWKSVGLPRATVDMVQFADARLGWAATRSDMYSSIDGGGTWTVAKNLPLDVGSMPAFRNTSEGWVGAGGTGDRLHVYSTPDFGLSWRRIDLPMTTEVAPETPVGTFVQLLPGHGVVVSSFQGNPSTTYTYTSFDGGTSWALVATPTSDGDLGALSFEDATHWWMVRALDLFKTADAGHSWAHVDGNYLPSGLGRLQVLDAMHAWGITGDQGYGDGLAVTSDGGFNWTRVKPPSAK